MTFSLLRRLAGTRGLARFAAKRGRSGCFQQWCTWHRSEPRCDGAPPPNHFGTARVRARRVVGMITRKTAASSRCAIPFVWATLRPVQAPAQATRWDALLWARAAAVTAVALLVAWLVAAATDEGGVGWGARTGRTLPLTPVCAALGVWVALAPVRARGEARALQALGRSPGQVSAAAIAGAATIALVAAVATGALRGVDVAGFYPTATHARTWEWRDQAFVDRARGLRVTADGVPERVPQPPGPQPQGPIPPHGRVAAALAMAAAGLALPLLVAHAAIGRRTDSPGDLRRRRYERLAIAAASACAVAASVLCFQAAAARLLPAMTGVLPPLALLALGLKRYRASS